MYLLLVAEPGGQWLACSPAPGSEGSSPGPGVHTIALIPWPPHHKALPPSRAAADRETERPKQLPQHLVITLLSLRTRKCKLLSYGNAKTLEASVNAKEQPFLQLLEEHSK